MNDTPKPGTKKRKGQVPADCRSRVTDRTRHET